MKYISTVFNLFIFLLFGAGLFQISYAQSKNLIKNISSVKHNSYFKNNTTYQNQLVNTNNLNSKKSLLKMGNPFSDTLFFDDFENGSSNWTITNDGGTCVWQVFTNPNITNRYQLPPEAGGGIFAADADNCGNGTSTITTAYLNELIENCAGIGQTLLEWDNDWNTAGPQDSAFVEASSDYGVTWQIIWSKIGVSDRNSHDSATIPPNYNMIKFRTVQPGWDWWWAIDNVTITNEWWITVNRPTGLNSQFVSTNPPQVLLQWKDNSSNEDGFDIQRKLGDSTSTNDYILIKEVAPNDTSYTDTTAAVNNVYTYRVRAYAYFDTYKTNSCFSNQSEVNTIVPVELVNFSLYKSANNVILNWSTVTETNNKGFEIQRKSGNNGFSPVGFVSGNGTSSRKHFYSFTDKHLTCGIYIYRLKQIDYNGTYKYSNEINADIKNPKVYSLSQNYPNPFNPNTKIDFSLSNEAKVTLRVYNILGQMVAELINSDLTAGYHSVNFNASNLPGGGQSLASGIYIYMLKAKGADGSSFSSVKKMALSK